VPSRHLYTHLEARAAERREALEKGFMRRAGLLVAALAAAATLLGPSMVPAARAADPAAPTVASFTPASGGDGTSVVITGTNFVGVTDVSFTLSSSLSFTVDSPTQITAQVPPNVYGPGKVRVANAAGTGASTTNFTPTAPFIYSFTPSSGPTGANVVITGNNLDSVTNVSLYVVNTTFTVNSPTQITAQVPANVPGPGRWRVTNPNGTGTSGGIFTPTAPIVSGFIPTSGPSGSRVTITGSGFAGATAVSLYFRPASFTVDSPTQITATVPPDVPGPGKWRITSPSGMGQSATQYAPTSPAVNSFAPASGPVGSKVTLTGINFDGVTKVSLYFVDAAFVYNSPTSITVTVPPGVPGPGRFRVTTSRGLATSNDQFSVTASGLHVLGNQLLDANGMLVRLHGVNYSGPEYACIQGWGIFDGPSDDASVAAMASWRVNVVRIPLNEDCWLGINGVPAAYDGANYRTAIAAYVNLLHQHGMYAELSLIWAAPGTYQATYQSGAPDADHSPAFWSSLATTFAGDSKVILAPWGETIVNANCFLNGGVCEATYGPSNTPYNTAGMQQAVNLMRQAGYNGVISIPGIDYANDMTQWLSHKPVDPLGQLIAEAHVYGKNTCDTTACFDTNYAPVAASVPLLFGETGNSYDDSVCGSGYVSTFMNWADAHNTGYEAWTWDTWGTCGSLITDFNGTPNGTYGTYVKNHYATLP